jgi:hypothetical protein
MCYISGACSGLDLGFVYHPTPEFTGPFADRQSINGANITQYCINSGINGLNPGNDGSADPSPAGLTKDHCIGEGADGGGIARFRGQTTDLVT